MAENRKYKRVDVGSICVPSEETKRKNPDAMDYIKLNPRAAKDLIEALESAGDKGLFLNLETRSSKLASLENAVENGKLSEEHASPARERIENTPWYNPETKEGFVRFSVVLVNK